jgi:hypothetical protein
MLSETRGEVGWGFYRFEVERSGCTCRTIEDLGWSRNTGCHFIYSLTALL